MTEEIINSDGSRNWEANILLDNIKRLEQENKELKKQIESQKGLITVGGKQQYEMTMAYNKCKSALEEIRDKILNQIAWEGGLSCLDQEINNKINEALK